MSFLAFIIVGVFSGFLAGKIVEGHGFGVINDMIVGIVGAIVGGLLFSNSGMQEPTFVGAILTSTAGAIILLILARIFSHRRSLSK